MHMRRNPGVINDDGTTEEDSIEYPVSIADVIKELAAQGIILPSNFTERHLNAYGIYSVQYDNEPNYDKFSQKLVTSSVPEKINGKWKLTHTVENMPQDEAEATVRSHRNFLIAETDWWAGSDHTMTQAQSDYRSALRNVPQQEGFPFAVVWPTKP